MKQKRAVWLSGIILLASLSRSFGQTVTQWPLRVDSPDGTVTVYEPQPEKFEGDTLTARAAVSLTPTGATDPEFGAVWFQSTVVTDRDSRLVTIQNISVKRIKLPNSAPDAEARFGQVLQQQIPPLNVVLGLEQLEATLGVVQKAKEESQQLQNTPPKIVFTTTPTTLVLLDGPPKLQPSATQGVMSVVNTPFIMLLDLQAKTYYLKLGETWLSAPDVTGPWSPAPSVSLAVAAAGAKLSPPADANTPQPSNGPTQILVAEEPTEVISSQGAPTYTPLPGNDLLYMSNTDSDVFMDIASQQYFVLLSGRWFSGPGLQGPWAFVASDKLPGGFAQIPLDSPKAHVLVSVAGTQSSKDARLDAFIPQTTTIRRDSGASLNVTYDGDPQFVPVENTPITYASNCADPVLFVENSYYCCHQAVWYRGVAAIGPWEVCTAVPQVIYTLPPSCPVYNCRYCYVYDSTPDVVYCGYLPGYTGCYVYGATVVYGTGYRYPYWYHTEFIPHPYTWGFAPRYDYYAGTWGFGASIAFNPFWFAARPHEHAWFGPQGYVDYRQVHANYNRGRDVTINNVHNVTVNRINIYNRPENVKRNIVVNDVHRNVEINNNRNTVVHQNAPAKVEHPAENNVYVDHDGQVYRRTDKGWEAHDTKGWSQLKSTPGATPEAHPADHAEKIPQHAEPTHTTPTHEEPSHVTPHVEEPQRSAPARVEPSGGLEDDHAARVRGGERPTESPSNPHAAPAEHAAPSGGGDSKGGGSNGGGNKSKS